MKQSTVISKIYKDQIKHNGNQATLYICTDFSIKKIIQFLLLENYFYNSNTENVVGFFICLFFGFCFVFFFYFSFFPSREKLVDYSCWLVGWFLSKLFTSLVAL